MIKQSNILILLFGFFCLAGGFHATASFAQEVGLGKITAGDQSDDFKLDEEWDINDELPAIEDPYEKYNRFMFNVNDKIYKRVFVPLSNIYDFLVPKKVQGCISNFIRFAATPKRFFNNLFQKKPKSAFIEFERLLINSSIGIGGIFDPAKGIFGLEQQTEDFGQTLGYYGVEEGPYFIWPIIGPSTRREIIGTIGDFPFNPLQWFAVYDVEPEDFFRGFRIIKRVNNYSYGVRDLYDRITEAAIDPYIAVQQAFIQNRNKQIAE